MSAGSDIDADNSTMDHRANGTDRAGCEATADESNGWSELRTSPAWKEAGTAIADHLDTYLRSVGGEPLVSAVERSLPKGKPFMWAGIHREDTWHVPHVHVRTGVVGTLYISTPASAGPITFADPRRPWGEQHQGTSDAGAFETDIVLQPEAGMIVFFPPWLSHYVGRTATVAPGTARIALSFNVQGSWGALAARTAQMLPPGPSETLEQIRSGHTGNRSRHTVDSAEAGVGVVPYLAKLRAEGRLADAEPSMRAVYAGNRERKGARHKDTVVAMENLIQLLVSLNKYAEAESISHVLLLVRLRTVGIGHVETDNAIGTMEYVLVKQDKSTTKVDRILQIHKAGARTAHRVGSER